MDLLKTMRAFVFVVEEGGFAAASRALGVSAPAVTKYVQQLETHLGVQLLLRSTRQVAATDAGNAFFADCKALLQATDAAINAVTHAKDEVRGSLRVNAPMSFGTAHLAPLVAAFMARHPDLKIELVLNDRRVDPIAEGFDVSLRIAEIEESTSLAVRPLATARRIMCASSRYLSDHGPLLHPADLLQHRCLHYGYQHSGQRWRMLGPDGEEAYAVNCTYWSNNGNALRTAALAHQGVTLLPTFIVGRDLQEGRLKRVLPEYEVSDLNVHIVYARHRHLMRNVLAFTDYIGEQLSGTPTWDQAI